MTFAQFNLNPLILKAIEVCGYTHPTPIQIKSVPSILQNKDIVACAQTGSGKTAAFVLPTLHNLARGKSGVKPRALILSPTRELAIQITKATSKYGKFLNLSTVSLVGGEPYSKQLKYLSRSSDIIVATPGRLLDHMSHRKIDLSRIEMLVLDEADRMLDMGFIDDVQAIAKKIPQNKQTLLFSATLDSRLKKVVSQLLKNPINIGISSGINIPNHIRQELYRVDNTHHKIKVLEQLILQENIYKAIIFTATKMNADKLAKQLAEQNYLALPLHGDLKQNVRHRNLDRLRSGKIQFLVATDIAARGIDVLDISHVINYDVPKFYEDYIHRIGRTGRAGKSGTAILLGLPEDNRQIQRIEKHTGIGLKTMVIKGLEPKKTSSRASKPPVKKAARINIQAKKKAFKSSHKKRNKITRQANQKRG